MGNNGSKDVNQGYDDNVNHPKAFLDATRHVSELKEPALVEPCVGAVAAVARGDRQ